MTVNQRLPALSGKPWSYLFKPSNNALGQADYDLGAVLSCNSDCKGPDMRGPFATGGAVQL